MSYANSKIPESAQSGVHEARGAGRARHAAAPFRKPYADYNRTALAESLHGWNGRDPVIPRCGLRCGAFDDSAGARNPGHWVIGVDQSADRLARRKPYPEALLPTNMVLVRADLVDYWRLLCDAGVRLERHYILYPNPWPKIGHLGRRWHAHPVFPYLPRLGGGSNAAPTGRCILRIRDRSGIVAGMPGEVANIPCRAADFAVRAQIPGLGTDAVPIDDRFRSSFGGGAADPFSPTHGTGND